MLVYQTDPEGSSPPCVATWPRCLNVFKHMAMISFVIVFDLLIELGTILPNIQGLPGLRRRL